MSFEELQTAWQSTDHSIPLQIPTELLLKEVRRNHEYLEAMVLRRDVMEIAAATLVVGFCIYSGVKRGDWLFLVPVVATVFVAVFLLVDRWLQYRRRPKSDESLLASVQASLAQVNHQIWLLQNILWWYLLPCLIGWGSIVGKGMLKQRPEVPVWLYTYVALGLFFFYAVYRWNLRGVKKGLLPRREELEALLASLK